MAVLSHTPHTPVCVLYRPNRDDSIWISLSANMDHRITTHPNSLFLIYGDFKCHHANWLGVGITSTSHGIAANDFCTFMGLTQSVDRPTLISPNSTSSFLDFVMMNFPANTSCSSSAPTDLFDRVLVRVNIALTFVRLVRQHRRNWQLTQAD